MSREESNMGYKKYHKVGTYYYNEFHDFFIPRYACNNVRSLEISVAQPKD